MYHDCVVDNNKISWSYITDLFCNDSKKLLVYVLLLICLLNISIQFNSHNEGQTIGTGFVNYSLFCITLYHQFCFQSVLMSSPRLISLIILINYLAALTVSICYQLRCSDVVLNLAAVIKIFCARFIQCLIALKFQVY